MTIAVAASFKLAEVKTGKQSDETGLVVETINMILQVSAISLSLSLLSVLMAIFQVNLG